MRFIKRVRLGVSLFVCLLIGVLSPVKVISDTASAVSGHNKEKQNSSVYKQKSDSLLMTIDIDHE